MKVTATKFDSIHHYSQLMHSSAHGDHIFHGMDVWREIYIDNLMLCENYQTGQSFMCGDYNLPRNWLELSEEGGASNLLILIAQIASYEFEDESKINEIILELNNECAKECKQQQIDIIILNKEIVKEIWDLLQDSPDCDDYLDDAFKSNNLDDYDLDDDNFLTPKNEDDDQEE